MDNSAFTYCEECEQLQGWYQQRLFEYVWATSRRQAAASLTPKDFSVANGQAKEAERLYRNARSVFLEHVVAGHAKES
jgi:hypothetical protein